MYQYRGTPKNCVKQILDSSAASPHNQDRTYEQVDDRKYVIIRRSRSISTEPPCLISPAGCVSSTSTAFPFVFTSGFSTCVSLTLSRSCWVSMMDSQPCVNAQHGSQTSGLQQDFLNTHFAAVKAHCALYAYDDALTQQGAACCPPNKNPCPCRLPTVERVQDVHTSVNSLHPYPHSSLK